MFGQFGGHTQLCSAPIPDSVLWSDPVDPRESGNFMPGTEPGGLANAFHIVHSLSRLTGYSHNQISPLKLRGPEVGSPK